MKYKMICSNFLYTAEIILQFLISFNHIFHILMIKRVPNAGKKDEVQLNEKEIVFRKFMVIIFVLLP